MMPARRKRRRKSQRRNSELKKNWEGQDARAFPKLQMILNLRGLGLSCAFGNLSDGLIRQL
jgi:uncharacterized protein YukE